MTHASRIARTVLVAVLVAALFASVGTLAAVGKGKPPKPGKGKNDHPTTAEHQYDPAGHQYGKQKVVICHKGKTITVGKPAAKAHLRHGDTLGPCP